MTNIGYATLSIIPSLDGVSKSVEKQLGGSLDGKKFGKAFGKDLADGVKASESDVKKAFEGHAKLADRAADATGKLKVAQAGYQDLVDKGVKSGQRYERAKAQVEKATRDEVRATRAATEALKDYETAQKRAANGVDNIGSGLGAKLKSLAGDAASGGSEAASGFVEGFGGPIAALGTKAGPIGLALAAAAGVALGAGALIAQQVMAGMDRELAADRIQAQLGLTDAEAAQFGKSAGTVYGGAFGESLGDVQQAMSDVASTLDMSSGAALEDMTAKALTFRDVFGTDVGESIALAQNMIVNGLAPDASAAFDLITTAVQRVPAALRDETFEALDEYSTYFSSLGFSGEEAAGMVVNMADRGKIALDKLGDSLKEFGIRATDLDDKGAMDTLFGLGLNGGDVANNLLAGGDAAQQQFDRIIDGLLALEDPAEQARAAIALFGTPLEDLDKRKIPEFLAGLDNAETAMQGFAGSSQEMVDTVGDNAATSIEGAKRAIESGVGSMQTSMAQAFGPAAQDLANWVMEHQEEITQFFMTAANAAAEFGSAVGYTVGGILTTLGQLVSAIGDTSGWIVEGFSTMVGAAATVADALGQDGLAGDLRGAQDTLSGFAQDLHGWGEGMVDLGGSITGAAGKLHDFDANMVGTQTSAQNAAAQIENVSAQIAGLPSGAQINIDAIVVYKDQAGRAIDPAQLLGFNPNEFATAGDAQRARRGLPYNAAPAGPITPSVTSVRPGLPSSLIPFPSKSGSSSGGGASSGRGGSSGGGGSSTAPTYFDPSLSQGPGTAQPGQSARNFAHQSMMPFWQSQGLTVGDHAADGHGEHQNGALDIMVPDIATGNRVLQQVLSDPNVYGAIFNQTSYGYGNGPGGTPMEDRGSPTQNHMDHVHAWYKPGGENNITPGGGSMLDPGMSAAPVAAGGYEVDQQAVFDAESKVLQDQQELEEKRLKLLELKADGNAKQSQILAAENDIEQQTRDLQSSQMKLAEAKQGKLREAKSASGGRGSSSGGLGVSVPSSLGGFGESFGGAIGSAIDGQVSSALGVFGVPESPGWLKGISSFIGGMSISGPGGAAPASAASSLGGVAPPGGAHGARAGQQPGPTTNYNIRTATVEDAFLAARRKENELSLARLSSN